MNLHINGDGITVGWKGHHYLLLAAGDTPAGPTRLYLIRDDFRNVLWERSWPHSRWPRRWTPPWVRRRPKQR